MLNWKCLEEVEEYMNSGRMDDEFKWSAEERRGEMLEFLEKLMDVADIADRTATRLIFKGSKLGALMGETDALLDKGSPVDPDKV